MPIYVCAVAQSYDYSLAFWRLFLRNISFNHSIHHGIGFQKDDRLSHL